MVASLWGSVSTGTKEDESSTGRVWAVGFHRVTARFPLARFETYEPFVSLNFHIFLGHGKRRIPNPRIRVSACTRIMLRKRVLTPLAPNKNTAKWSAEDGFRKKIKDLTAFTVGIYLYLEVPYD
jgi:hypothetical protein